MSSSFLSATQTYNQLMAAIEPRFTQLRRGIPVAHKLFGVPQTINCANYVYFLAYQQLSALQSLAQNGANLLEIVNGQSAQARIAGFLHLSAG